MAYLMTLFSTISEQFTKSLAIHMSMRMAIFKQVGSVKAVQMLSGTLYTSSTGKLQNYV